LQIIEVIGLASGRVIEIVLNESDLQKDLLSWLRSRGITIASSCDGQAVCKKCCIQNDWLTCVLTLEEFLKRQPDRKIIVSYL
jgi:Na+-transporting NADH:ubiquinone oxidoreductase subunit NqrF